MARFLPAVRRRPMLAHRVAGPLWLLAVGAALFPLAQASAAAESEVLAAPELTARIDQTLGAAWKAARVQPAEPADDAEFVRRIYLHLVGKIPSAAEARSFLDDRAPGKRRALVEELLSRGSWAAHFANVWRSILLAGTAADAETRALAPQLENWLRLRFAGGVAYDQLAAELLTASSRNSAPRRAAGNLASPLAFYRANGRKPEMLAASTSRIFLGVQVQCAQCHDHPFAKWKQQSFWSMAAFFTGLEGTSPDVDAGPIEDSADREGIRIPDLNEVVPAAFLDGGSPEWQPGESKRAALARWMIADDNPYFARAAVNRMWEHFFGRGFVMPVDDLDPANPPAHAELFELLTGQFIAHGYDFKFLVRAITASEAYQLSSRGAAPADDELHLFARMPLRRMSSDQLLDSLVQATGYREAKPDSRMAAAATLSSLRAAVAQKFPDQNVPSTDAETSVLEALSLMNGTLVAGMTNPAQAGVLRAIVQAPYLSANEQVESLYLAALSRRPSEEELAAAREALAQAGGAESGLADLLWTLLNSAEFLLVH